MKYILDNLKDGRRVKFIYAPKNISKYYKDDFIKHPLYGYYNNFYLINENNNLYFVSEDGNILYTNNPKKAALDLFYEYYYDPNFSTMVALTDKIDNNLIFYNSDTGDFYTYI